MTAMSQGERLRLTTIGRLAKSASEEFVKRGSVLPFDQMMPSELLQQRACFVSIIENPGRRQRSMYGHMLPQYPTLAQEVVQNTIQAVQAVAGRHVSRGDLPQLNYSVAVLGPLQRVAGPEHLNPAVWGLYVTSDRGKSALMLPERAGVDTPEDQLATALRESGIDQTREVITLYRFDVEHHDS